MSTPSPRMIRFVARLALVAGALLIPSVARSQTAAWSFETVAPVVNTANAGCAYSATPTGFGFDAANRPVIGWTMLSHCSGGSDARWARKEEGGWTIRQFAPVRYSGGGVSSFAHRLVMRPDGTPFVMFAALDQQWQYDFYVWEANLDRDPFGPGVNTGDFASHQDCFLSGLQLRGAFSTAGGPLNHLVAASCGTEAMLRVNGTPISVPHSLEAASFAYGPGGQPHVLYASDGQVYYTSAPPASGVSVSPIRTDSENVAIAVGPDNRLHAVVGGGATGAIDYFVSTDGVSWKRTPIAPLGATKLSMSIAVDANGAPAIAYLSDGGLWLALRTPDSWETHLVRRFESLTGVGEPEVAFDRDGIPAIAFFDPGVSKVLIARPAAPTTVDVSVTGIDSPDPVPAGRRVTFTLTAANPGDRNASGVALDVHLDPALSMIKASPLPASSQGNHLRFEFGALPSSGHLRTVVIDAVTGGEGILATRAALSSSEPDDDPLNNVLTLSTKVRAASCLAPRESLVALWAGDGDSRDAVRREDAVTHGGVTFTPGRIGQAFALNGTDASVDVAADGVDPVGSFSVQAWVRTTSAVEYQAIVSKIACGRSCFNSPTSAYLLGLSAGAASWVIQTAAGDRQFLIGTRSLADGQFHHLAGVRDVENAQLRLYVDGVLDASAPLTAIGPLTPQYGDIDPLVIGAAYLSGVDAKGYYFAGAIDDVGFYDRALTGGEVKVAHGAPTTAACGAPTVDPLPDQANNEGESVRLAVMARDVDGDPLAFSAVNLPAGLAIDPVAGVISGVLAGGSAADYSPTVTVDDGEGGTASTTFRWKVSTTRMETSMTLAVDANPARFRQRITFTAHVFNAVSALAPAGTVRFVDENDNRELPLGAAAIDGEGYARFTTTQVAIGRRHIRAIYDGEPPFLGSFARLEVRVPVPNADLGVHMVAKSPTVVGMADSIWFEVSVTNHGPEYSPGLGLNILTPGAIVHEVPEMCNPFYGLLCTLPELAPGESWTFPFRVIADAMGVFENVATVVYAEGDPGDPDPLNNVSEIILTYQDVSDLAVSLTADKAAVRYPDRVAQTIVVTNYGPSRSRLVILSGLVEGEATCSGPTGSCMDTPQSIQASVPAMNPGESTTFVLNVGFLTAPHLSRTRITLLPVIPFVDPNPRNDVAVLDTDVSIGFADLSTSVAIDPAHVKVGERGHVTVTVTNHGPDSSLGAVVTIATDAVANTGAMSNTNGSCSPPGVCVMGLMPPGTSAQIAFDIASPVVGPVVLTAAVAQGPFSHDNRRGNNASLGRLLVKPNEANLVVRASASGRRVMAGADVLYTATVTNNGPDSARSATLTIGGLPGAVVSIAGASCIGVVCELGDLPADGYATITVVSSTTAPGVFVATFNAASQTIERAPVNNVDTVTTTVDPPTANLRLTVTRAVGRLFVGDLQTMTATVTNNGPATASAVTIESPALGGSVISTTATQGSCVWAPFACPIGPLAPGQSATVTVVISPADTNVGPARADFVTAAATIDPVLANNTGTALFTVDPRTADLDVFMRAPAQGTVGGQATHVIIVRNGGLAPADGVGVTASLVGRLVSIDSSHGACVGTASLLTCSLGTMTRGERATITVITSLGVINAGPGTDHAAVASTTIDPNLTDNAMDAPIFVRP